MLELDTTDTGRGTVAREDTRTAGRVAARLPSAEAFRLLFSNILLVIFWTRFGQSLF